jgi:hypothetical protein
MKKVAHGKYLPGALTKKDALKKVSKVSLQKAVF